MQHGLLGRSPYYQNRGDLLLGILILWNVVLPSTSMVWSIDAAMASDRASDNCVDGRGGMAGDDGNSNGEKSSTSTSTRTKTKSTEPSNSNSSGSPAASTTILSSPIISLATVGYLWQVMCVYIFSGYAKTGKDWKEGWAVTATLNLETYNINILTWRCVTNL